MATGYAKITATSVTAVGTIQSTHQYDVTVRFEIAISPYGRNETGGANYSITIDGSNSGSRSCTFNSRGGYVTIGSYTKRVTMDKSGQAKTINISAALNTGISPSSISGSTTYELPAVTWQWAVSYNANGGSGAPASQTKTYGSNLTLSSTKPTRTGYTFLGWSTDKNATSATYQSSGSYTSNSGAILYAVWKKNTYTVSYNANGGSGAPASQTKTYGATLTLSSTKPTRTNYNFKGWSKDKNAATPTYSAGGVYTEDTAVTLYAVWELAYWSPKITDVYVHRCTDTGVNDEEGLYAKVDFKWECCQILGVNNVKSITVADNIISVSGTSGSVAAVVGGNYSIDEYYSIPIVVVDSKNGTSTYNTYVESYAFAIDIKAGGKGVAFGMPAKEDGFHVNFPSHFYEAIICDVGIQSEEGSIGAHELIGDFIKAYSDLIVGDDPINDFVVAQGRSGIWTYRKWRNGFAECWCTTSNNVAANTKWGNAYYSQYLQGGYALPFTFIETGDFQDAPQGFVEIQTAGGNYSFQVANSCTTTNAPKGYVMCPIQHNDSIQVLFSFYIRGRWKK